MSVPERFVDLRDIWSLLWGRKWLVILACVIAAAMMAGLSVLVPKKYEAIIVVSPVPSSTGQGGGLGSLVSQFGSIASLAGLSIGGADSTKSESFAFLKSKLLLSDYISDHDLLKVLFADRWLSSEQKWKLRASDKAPTLWQGVDYFNRSIRAVALDTTSGLVSLRVVWTDPQIAANWANDLVASANSHLRERAISESERNIAYLNEQAARTEAVGVRQAIYAVLQTEINKVMIARGTDQFAFKVIDPAVAPEKPSSPGLVVWAGLGMLLALLGAVTIAFLNVAFRDLR